MNIKTTDEERLKLNIEIYWPGDGRVFVNFWNWRNGNDVIAELIDGKLIRDDEEISLPDFINNVKKSYENHH